MRLRNYLEKLYQSESSGRETILLLYIYTVVKTFNHFIKLDTQNTQGLRHPF